jgi:hypothetical protein
MPERFPVIIAAADAPVSPGMATWTACEMFMRNENTRVAKLCTNGTAKRKTGVRV